MEEQQKRQREKLNVKERRVSEEIGMREKEIAWGLVPALNISITDWVAMKMLLIHSPKDFYKTSISLSWLQHSGIHRGKKSKKCSEGEKKTKTFLTKWIPSKWVIFIMLYKVIFSSSAVLLSIQDKRCNGFCMYIKCWEHANFEDSIHPVQQFSNLRRNGQ